MKLHEIVINRKPFPDGSRCYNKYLVCGCGYQIVTETWDSERCFGSGTVLKNNHLPKYCPNCGNPIDSDGIEYNTTYCNVIDNNFNSNMPK